MKRNLFSLAIVILLTFIGAKVYAQKPTGYVYSPSTVAVTVGSTVSITPVRQSGATANGFAISPATLPAGLSFSTTTGAITGIPTAVTSQTTFTVTPSNGSGNGTTFTLKLTVSKGTITITANDVSKTYGTAITSPGSGSTAFTVTGLAPGDDISTVSISYGTGATAVSGVNTYSSQVTPSAAIGTYNAANYNAIVYNKGAIIVGKALLTVTANNQTRVYGASNPAFTLSYSGFVNGEGTGVLNTAPSGSTTATSASSVGTYAITVGGGSDNDYSFSYVSGFLTITPANLTITANNASKTYGATLSNPASGSSAFTATGLAGGTITVTLTYSAGSAATDPGGTTGTITPSSATGSGFSASNYNITYSTGTLTVTAAALTISASNVSHTYGTTLASPGAGATAFTSSGLKNGESIGSATITYGTGASAASSAGTYSKQAFIASATGGTFNPGNYNITYDPGNITVSQASLTITLNIPNKAYGSPYSILGNTTTSFTYSGAVNSDVPTTVYFESDYFLSNQSAGSTYNIYPYNITGNGSFNANNYSITYVNTTGTIQKATLTITAGNVSKTYGATLASPGSTTTGYTVTGLQNSEKINSVTITYGSGKNASDPAGTYNTIVPSGASGSNGYNVNNYSITYTNGNIFIGAASLTITATSVNKPYGTVLTSGPASAGFSASGLVNSETLSTVYLTYSAGYHATDAIGTTGTITPSLPLTGSGTFAAGNYSITYTPGALTICAATFDWTGALSSDWATPGNWSVNGVQQTSTYPGQNETTDIAAIGVVAYSANQPAVATNLPNSLSALTFGNAAIPASLSLAANVNFNVSGTTLLNTGSEVVNLSIDNTSSFTTANYTSNSGATFNALGGGSINITGAYSNTGSTNFGSGPVTMSGSFTNGGATTFGTGLLTFNSTTNQDFLTAKGTTSTVIFNNVLFTGGAAYTFRTTPNGAAGNFELASTGVLNINNNTTIIIANASFTLLSDAGSSASIGQITDASKINGNVNVQRYITGGAGMYRGYRLLSSPVNTGAQDAYNNNIISINYLTVNSFVTGSGSGFNKTGNPSLYLFRENLAPLYSTFLNSNYRGFSDISNASAYQLNPDGTFSLPVGNGYLFFFRGGLTTANPYTTSSVPDPATLVATGNLNQGSITVHDWYTAASANLADTNVSGDPTIEGLNLVGNPYASSIDLNTMSATNTAAGIYAPNVNPVIYLLNPTSHNYDYYDTSLGTGAGSQTTNIVSSGLGFFVVATDPTAQLTFNESAKVTTQVNGPSLYMGKPMTTETASYLRLEMAADSVNKDATLINFKDQALAAYSLKEDAPYKIGSGKVSLATTAANHTNLMAINRRPLKDKTVAIPLSVNAKSDGTYSLSLETIKSVPQLYDIWLIDSYKKDSLDMRHNKTYRFDVFKSDTASCGSYRFTLVMRQNPALAYHLLKFTADKATGRQVQVNWVSEHEANYTKFTVERSTDGGVTFTILGGVASTGAGAYGFTDKNPGENNLYRLKQEDINNNITYSHVIPVGFSNLSNNLSANNINVFPNPASNQVNMTVNAAVAHNSASYNFTITNSYGLLIKQGTSNQATWATNVSDLLPGTYIIQIVNNNDKSFVGKSKLVKL